MPSKTLIICAIFCFIVNEVYGQVGSLCRPNERLLECGCPKTCRDPAPDCKAMCKTGCFCEEGQVRNDDGLCVNLADCPPMPTPYKLQTTEPLFNGGKCPPNEEYKFCEPCNKTCENPFPVCPAQCARGCFCKDGLVRDKDGRCVIVEMCSNVKHLKFDESYVQPVPSRVNCGPYQVYRRCGTCDKTCQDPNPVCKETCRRGCFCQEGYVKSDGICVKLEDCPNDKKTFPPVLMTFGVRDLSVEDCGSREEFLSCGWCEPSCSEPAPSCPVGVCTRGCLCRPPLIRHKSGRCVQEKYCLAEKCQDQNEEYICRYGCEPSCEHRICLHRPRRCELGCYCKIGLMRHKITKKCVTPDQCNNNTITIL